MNCMPGTQGGNDEASATGNSTLWGCSDCAVPAAKAPDLDLDFEAQDTLRHSSDRAVSPSLGILYYHVWAYDDGDTYHVRSEWLSSGSDVGVVPPTIVIMNGDTDDTSTPLLATSTPVIVGSDPVNPVTEMDVTFPYEGRYLLQITGEVGDRISTLLSLPTGADGASSAD
jgi:hypothetical protein